MTEIKNSKIYTTIESITPAMAAQWLEADRDNVFQRRPSAPHVAAMARDMAAKRWQLNGESIVLNGSAILDGRQRLAAIVQSGETVPMLVVRNVALSAFATIDIGKRRTVGDIVQMAGHVNATILGSIARFIVAEERGMLAMARMPECSCAADELLAVIRQCPGIEDAAAFGRAIRPMLAPSIAGYCYYRGNQTMPGVVEQFFAALQSGENMTRTMPVWHLREQLLGQTRTRKIPIMVQLALTMKAMNLTHEGRQIKQLVWRANEPFPSWPSV